VRRSAIQDTVRDKADRQLHAIDRRMVDPYRQMYHPGTGLRRVITYIPGKEKSLRAPGHLRLDDTDELRRGFLDFTDDQVLA